MKGAEIPMRRWEDWERSRLRKLRREERRRKEFERNHPSGYFGGESELLAVRAFDSRSQYDGSDTVSMASSDDDHWGPQIGGYNEHNMQYPPPPVALLPPQVLQSAKTIGGAELEAILESGFNEHDEHPPPSSTYAPRYQLSDGSTAQLANVNEAGYAPLTRSTSPSPVGLTSPTSPTNSVTNGPPGSIPAGKGQYGPLGPLDPATRF